MALRQSVAVSGINERVKAYHPPMEAPYSCVTRGAWLCSVRLFYPCLNGPLGLQTIVSSPTSFLLSPACSLTFLFKRFPLIDKTSECSIYIAPPLLVRPQNFMLNVCKTWCATEFPASSSTFVVYGAPPPHCPPRVEQTLFFMDVLESHRAPA